MKRILYLALVLAIMASVLPNTVFAANGDYLFNATLNGTTLADLTTNGTITYLGSNGTSEATSPMVNLISSDYPVNTTAGSDSWMKINRLSTAIVQPQISFNVAKNNNLSGKNLYTEFDIRRDDTTMSGTKYIDLDDGTGTATRTGNAITYLRIDADGKVYCFSNGTGTLVIQNMLPYRWYRIGIHSEPASSSYTAGAQTKRFSLYVDGVRKVNNQPMYQYDGDFDFNRIFLSISGVTTCKMYFDNVSVREINFGPGSTSTVTSTGYGRTTTTEPTYNVKITPSDDNVVYDSVFNTTAVGTDANLKIKQAFGLSPRPDPTSYANMKFSLAGITNGFISSAKLMFYVNSVKMPNDGVSTRTINLYGTDASWDEATATYNSTSGNYSAADKFMGSFNFTPNMSGWVTVDISNYAKSCTDSGVLALTMRYTSNNNQDVEVNIDSKEGAAPPRLYVTTADDLVFTPVIKNQNNDIVTTVSSAGTYTASSTVYTTDTLMKPVLFIATFNKTDNMLLKCTMVEGTRDTNGKVALVSPMLLSDTDLPSGKTWADFSIKTFLWNGLDTMKPLK